jgi:hypothetical protein
VQARMPILVPHLVQRVPLARWIPTAIHRLLVTRAMRGRTRLRVLSNAASALRGPLIATLIHQRHAMAEHAQLAALVQQVQHHARCALLVRQTWTVIHRLLATLAVQARMPIQVPPHAPHVQQALPTLIKMLLPHARTAMQDSIHPAAQHHVLTARRARLTWTAIHRLLVTRAVRGRTRLALAWPVAHVLLARQTWTVIHRLLATLAVQARMPILVPHLVQRVPLARWISTAIHRLLARYVESGSTRLLE